MSRLGPARPNRTHVCNRCPNSEPDRFGIAAGWPLGVVGDGSPVILACLAHFTQAVNELIAEHAAVHTQEVTR
jgi:hypothetical protein